MRLRRRSWRITHISLLAIPFILSAAFTLERFSNAEAVIEELWRPLLTLELASGAMVFVLWAVLRRASWAGLLAGLFMMAIAAYVVPTIILIALVVWWLIASTFRGKGARDAFGIERPASLALAYSTALLLVGILSLAVALWPRAGHQPPLEVATDTSNSPNIYLVIVDGYPRSDTLAALADFDNRPFVRVLEAMSFDVATQSRSNYNKTWPTMASLLNAAYVHDLELVADEPDDAPAQVRLLHQAIDSGAVLDAFRAKSYSVVSIPSPARSTDTATRTEVLTGPHLTTFEVGLVSKSTFAYLFPDTIINWLAADARGMIEDQLRALVAIAEGPESPQFVIAHLLSPHAPFVMGQEPEYLRDCFPECGIYTTLIDAVGLRQSEYALRLSEQVNALNTTLIAAMEELVAADPSAVVILMSDHGIRYSLDDASEHFRSFFAARTPGVQRLFPNDISPVNVFRRLLTGMFGDRLPDLPYEAWISDWNNPLDLARYR